MTEQDFERIAQENLERGKSKTEKEVDEVLSQMK